MTLNEANTVACIGQFYKITKDGIPLNTERPFLDSEAFACSRKISCTEVTRKNMLDKGEYISIVFAMNKIYGLFIISVAFRI